MKSNKYIPTLIISFVAVLVGFTACDTADNNETDGNGRLSVQLTDAPADYDNVFIDIQSVRVHRNEDAETDSTDSDDEAEENGFITIMSEPNHLDLLQLRNGNTIQLGDQELEAGEYNQIRLILGPDNEVVIDGEYFPLKTPSAQQSGLKLKIDAEIEDGEIYNLLVDFDAERSIVETGNQKYILKPVLRAVQLEETGSISGTVQPSEFQTSVMAIADGDTLSTTTEADGEFAIIGVTTRTYNVVFKPNNEAYADSTITGVDVAIDQDVELGTLELEQL
jgi:hypothetical protein